MGHAHRRPRGEGQPGEQQAGHQGARGAEVVRQDLHPWRSCRSRASTARRARTPGPAGCPAGDHPGGQAPPRQQGPAQAQRRGGEVLRRGPRRRAASGGPGEQQAQGLQGSRARRAWTCEATPPSQRPSGMAPTGWRRRQRPPSRDQRSPRSRPARRARHRRAGESRGAGAEVARGDLCHADGQAEPRQEDEEPAEHRHLQVHRQRAAQGVRQHRGAEGREDREEPAPVSQPRGHLEEEPEPQAPERAREHRPHLTIQQQGGAGGARHVGDQLRADGQASGPRTRQARRTAARGAGARTARSTRRAPPDRSRRCPPGRGAPARHRSAGARWGWRSVQLHAHGAPQIHHRLLTAGRRARGVRARARATASSRMSGWDMGAPEGPLPYPRDAEESKIRKSDPKSVPSRTYLRF